MFRQSLRVVALLLMLGSALISSSAADAQTDNNDMVPDSVDLPSSTFRPVSAGDIAIAGANRVVESSPYGAPGAFTHLMLRWEVVEPGGSSTRVEYRTSNDDRIWSDWAAADPDDSSDLASGAREYLSGVVYTSEARLYQFRVTLSPGVDGSYPQLQNLEANTVDTRVSMPPGPLTRPEAQISAAAVSMPAYKSRTAWGNPQGESAPSVTGAFATPRTATHLIVHHTAGNYHTLDPHQTDWDAHVRAIWSFHTYTQKWGDIGYNWLIAPNGVIYAGRAGSTYSDAVGFHDTANFGSMGVSILGDYTNVAPSTAAQESLVRMLAWKASQRGIDPFGSSYYWGCVNWSKDYCGKANPTGVVANIEGHRKITPTGYTTCPGNAFYALLPSIKSRVSQLLSGAQNPDNGDLTIDERESSFTSEGSWKVASCGVGAQTYWTYATAGAGAGDVPSENRGKWTSPPLPKTGRYKVSFAVPQGCNAGTATSSATYNVVGHGNVTKSQNTSSQWVELGTFSYSAGQRAEVELTDLTGEPFSLRRVVFFDAVRWEYADEPPRWEAKILSARPVSNVVPTGGVLQVEFTIENTGNQPLGTQAPDGASIAGIPNGYVYTERQCFSGIADRETGMLRATLGFDVNSPRTAIVCAEDDGSYPWRWGLRSTTLQPGERRTITGYVQFDTRGTYILRANLISEKVGYYGVDGRGSPITVGPITVRDFPYRAFVPQSSP